MCTGRLCWTCEPAGRSTCYPVVTATRWPSGCAPIPACRSCAGTDADATALMQRADYEPQAPLPGADQPWGSLCRRCGRTVSPAYNNVRRGHAGCGHCAGTIVDPALAEQVMRAKGLEPLTGYPGVHVPWPSRCQTCTSTVNPRYAGVRAGQGGCRGRTN